MDKKSVFFFTDQQEILMKIPPRELVTAWLQQLNMISLCTKEGVWGGRTQG